MYTHIYLYMYVTTIKEKENMDFESGQEGIREGLEGRKRWGNYILISKIKNYILKNS